MRSRGPLFTLLAGLALAGVLVTLSINATRDTNLAGNQVNAPVAPGGKAAAPDDAAREAGAADKPAEKPAEKPEDKSAGAAPAAPAANLNVTWAGRTKGGKATVAITAKGDKAIAYVCDGDRIEAWLQGTAADGRLKLSAPEKSGIDAELTGTFGNGKAKGTITVEGEEFAFNVSAAKKPSGLYRSTADVRGAKLVGGWIVLADGTQVGLATFAGSAVRVPPLELASRTTTVYGQQITASVVDPGAGL